MTGKRAVAISMLGATLWALSGLWTPAQALSIGSTSNPQTFTGEKVSVNDSKSGDPVITDSSFGTSLFNQFNSSTGVLTQVSVAIASTLTPSITNASVGGGGSDKTATFTGSGTAVLSAPGISTNAGTATDSSSCAGNNCSFNHTGAGIAANGPIPAVTNQSDLNSYVGGGTITVTRGVSGLTATAGGTANSVSGTFNINWSGTLNTTYTYLLHALPSFASGSTLTSLIFDFGTVTQGAGAGQLSTGLSLFNRLNGGGVGDQVKLDLDTILGSGSTGTLFTNLTPTLNLINPGSSSGFTAFLDTTTVGTFTAAYTLTLSDENIGAPGTRYSYTPYTLTLRGEVVPFATPAPPALALLGTALAALWGADSIRRRRRSAGRR